MKDKEYKAVGLKVEKDFINKLGKKLNKEKCGEVVCEALELMNWVLERIENGEEIVAINMINKDKKKELGFEKFTTEGLTHFRNIVEEKNSSSEKNINKELS